MVHYHQLWFCTVITHVTGNPQYRMRIIRSLYDDVVDGGDGENDNNDSNNNNDNNNYNNNNTQYGA